MKIPTYIIRCLERYDNTIITKKDIRKFGSEKKFLEELKKHGYDCKLRNPKNQVEYSSKNMKTYDHYVVFVKGSHWESTKK